MPFESVKMTIVDMMKYTIKVLAVERLKELFMSPL
jgi:hypothetical protein